jgi:hypothetical protein
VAAQRHACGDLAHHFAVFQVFYRHDRLKVNPEGRDFLLFEHLRRQSRSSPQELLSNHHFA